MKTRRLYLPINVSCCIQNQIFCIEGSLGSQNFPLPSGLYLQWRKGRLDYQANWKLRTQEASLYDQIKKSLRGLHQGFVVHLHILGVGYRSEIDHGYLRLKLGKTQKDQVYLPGHLQLNCPQPRHILMQASQASYLYQMAAHIRNFHPPQTYKHKGIFYEGEKYFAKTGKTNFLAE